MPDSNDYQTTGKILLQPLFSRFHQEAESERAMAETRAREKTLTKPAGSLGRLELISEHLAYWQGCAPPRLTDVRVIVFAAKHGICAERVSAYPSVVTEQMVANFQNGGAAINQLCKLARAQLRVETLSLKRQTTNFLHEPAMSHEQCAQALAQGMDCLNQRGLSKGGLGEKPDLLALGEMGIGNSTAAAAMLNALYGNSAKQWTGRGTGLDEQGYQHKILVVEQAVKRFNEKYAKKYTPKNMPKNITRDSKRHKLSVAEVATERSAERAWDILRELGGFELAAIVGALIKARAWRIPTLLDGFPCCAAAAIAKSLHEHSLKNCLLAHQSAQQGAAQLNEKLALGSPILDLKMRLGEGSGAALAILILRAALACHLGMASFEQAAVETNCLPSKH